MLIIFKKGHLKIIELTWRFFSLISYQATERCLNLQFKIQRFSAAQFLGFEMKSLNFEF